MAAPVPTLHVLSITSIYPGYAASQLAISFIQLLVGALLEPGPALRGRDRFKVTVAKMQQTFVTIHGNIIPKSYILDR